MKRFYTALLLAIVGLTASLSLTSCIDDDDWNPYPPGGWNDTFYDSELTGCWQLVQVNSTPVYGDKSNYMQFFGNGRGWYYYYSNGEMYRDRMAYWCEEFFNGSGYYELNVQYENGQAATMTYWFTGRNNLWMKWNTSQGAVTYLYRYVDNIPW